MFLLIKGDSEKPPAAWVFGGVFLMLFASWSWAASLEQSIIGMLLFLGPWLMSAEEEESPLTKLFNDTSVRMKVARAIPWYSAAAFLTLTGYCLPPR